MRHLSVDYLSASSLSDCRSSLYTTICLNTAPQMKYLNMAPDMVAPWWVHRSTVIRQSKRFQNCFISFFIFTLLFFRSVFYRFRCVSVPADFYVSVFVNGFIIFPLTDISVSVNGNHTVSQVLRKWLNRKVMVWGYKVMASPLFLGVNTAVLVWPPIVFAILFKYWCKYQHETFRMQYQNGYPQFFHLRYFCGNIRYQYFWHQRPNFRNFVRFFLSSS